MKSLNYFNNTWLDEKNLKISALDLSVMRGFGIFDYLRTYDNKPFRLNDHIDRFFNSAYVLGIKIRLTKSQLKSIVLKGIKKNNFKETNIRIVASGGVSEDIITPGNPTIMVLFSLALKYPKQHYLKGVKVITYLHKREFANTKSLNYLTGVMAIQQAKRKNAIEAIYIDDKKRIYEGTTSNFFIVIKNKVITPKKDILSGVTRQVVLEIIRKLKIRIIEKSICFNDLKQSDEAFLTSTNKEIMPVVKVNNLVIGNGKAGSITKKIMDEFKILTKST